MFQFNLRRVAGLKARIASLCPEREIFLHSGGQVRFIRITRRAQILTLALILAVLAGWAAFTLSMAMGTAAIARDRAELTAQSKAVASRSSKVNAYRESVDGLVRDLEARQNFMDELYKTHFGADAQDDKDRDSVVGKPIAGTKAKSDRSDTLAAKISAAPEAAQLLAIEQRQRRFARILTRAVERRAGKAASAISSFGLNPGALVRNAGSAQGGPYVPWNDDDDALANEFRTLASALARMEVLERGLIAIPSGKPTSAPMLSSSYGYRRDPFNGQAAFHAGLDFPGAYGQPILAAARGRISYVGQRSGYGDVVEIDHGNGLMTRYAHLSGFSSKLGQKVRRGDAIAKMGSTGRSTGTHLHFEVRLNGQAINPRRFLEARKDVLKIQQTAKDRFADIGSRG